MSEEKQNSWENIIKKYIDDLDDLNMQENYINELLSSLFYKTLLLAKTTESDEEKLLVKEVKKIKKIKITARSKDNLENYYNRFLKKGWVESLTSEINFIVGKKCFYNIWISQSILHSERVAPATHIAKLTHSSCDTRSIYDKTTSINNKYLSTSTIKSKQIDGSYKDAADSKKVKFLLLEHDTCLLGDELINKNIEVFQGIASSREEAELWVSAYNKYLTQALTSHTLSKQVYMPISNNIDANKYHLLTILESSSLMQEVFITHFEKSKRKERDEIRKKTQESKYLDSTYSQLPNLANKYPVNSQPQSVSVFNSLRAGNIRLFSTEPPTWQKQLKPPIYKQSFFYACHNNNIDENLQYIADFLMRFEDLKSIQDPKLERHLIRWVRNIADDIIFYANTIQNLPHSWSDVETIKLKKEHQYYLDPFRTDDAFTHEKESSPWQGVVCRDFAQWMSYKLNQKDKRYTAQKKHRKVWIDNFEPMLRSDVDTLKLSMSYKQSKEQA